MYREFADNVREAKKDLRNKYKQIRNDMPAELKTAYDKAICDALLSLASFRFSETILMYAPINGEIDVMAIAENALALGKKVAFPVCDPETHTMEFKYVTSTELLTPGHYSIFEPSAELETVTVFSRSICLIPGIIFDTQGYRVGYGKGYYDRFLADYDGTKFGLVYSDFILDVVPRGRFDRHVDVLISEKGVRLAESKSDKKAK